MKHLLALASLLGCSSTALPPPHVVSNVDLARYAGTWHEIARLPNRFERNCADVTATYTLREDGDIDVLNRCVDRTTHDATAAKGKAWLATTNGQAKLSVRFFWPFKGDYWILALGQDYEFAVVGSPDRDYAWILSRTKPMSPDAWQSAIATLQREGFPIDRLEQTP
jgi:apolipoprotein D and lipocalin family protein